MKVQFIKDHGSHQTGDIIECGKTRAERFFDAKIAFKHGEVSQKEDKPAVQRVTKELKVKRKTK